MNTLDKMNKNSSTHIRLFSGSVKNFNLIKIDNDAFIFGFTLRKKFNFEFTPDEEDGHAVGVYIGREGLDSLINFLNRLRTERNDEDHRLGILNENKS